MRKLFWWGAAGLAASAGAFGLAAYSGGYSCGAWLGKSTVQNVASANAGGKDAVAREIHGLQNNQTNKSVLIGGEECSEPAASGPALEAREPIQVVDSEDVVGGVSTEVARLESPIQSSDSSDPSGPMVQTSPVSVPEDGLYMPPCPEDEVKDTPDVPYADVDEEKTSDTSSPFDVWLSWFTTKDGQDGKSGDQAESVPNLSSDRKAIPGMEPLVPTIPPRCQEDPYHHHHYSGCPYMGGLSHGGQYTPKPVTKPVIPDTKTPTKKKTERKKVKLDPSLLYQQVRSLKPVTTTVDDDDDYRLGACGVDTMECRPGDMKLWDIDSGDSD